MVDLICQVVKSTSVKKSKKYIEKKIDTKIKTKFIF